MEIPDCLGLTVEPAVAEDHADGVGAGLQLIGDVVGHIERASVVAGVAGVKQVVAHLSAVEVKLVIAEAADEGAGLADLAVELKNAAEQGGGVHAGVGSAGNPFCTPVAGEQKTHFPAGRLADAGTARLIPDANLPECLLTRAQRLAGVVDLRGFVRLDLAAVPQVRLVFLQSGGTASHEDLIRRLLDPTFARPDDPAQPRLRRVDAERVVKVLAPQSLHAHCGGRGGTKAQQQERKENRYRLKYL